MSNTSTFADCSSRFRLIFAQFDCNHQPISQLQQCNYISRAIAAHPHLVKAQDTYFQLCPDPTNRTFAAMVAHISLHAPNFAPTSADFGYSAATTAPSTTESLQAFLLSPQFATIIATAAAATKTQPSQSRNSNFPNRSTKNPKTPRKYCHLHGYDWHDGSDCRNMAKDNEKQSIFFGVVVTICWWSLQVVTCDE